MSIDFWTRPRLRMEELFDGRLEKWGIFEPTKDKKVLPDKRCLADGENCVWVYSCEDGMISVISSYGLYDPYDILKAISEAFEVDIWLELDLQAGHHKLVIKRPTVQRAAASSRAGELGIMSRRLDFNKAFRNHQARYGVSVKDEAEWMENDAAARWLERNGNRALRKADHRLSAQHAAPSGTKSPRRKNLKHKTCSY